MRSLVYNILLLIISIIRYPGSYSVFLKKELAGTSGNDVTFVHCDWELKENQTVGIYRLSNHHQFAFVAYNPQHTYEADVTLADTSSQFSISSKTCPGMSFSNRCGYNIFTDIIFEKYGGKSKTSRSDIQVSYTTGEVKDSGHWYVKPIDTSACDETEHSGSDTRVASAVTEARPILMIDNLEAFVNEADPTELETKVIFQSIGNAKAELSEEADNVPEKRESLVHDKKGICWKKNVDVICLQVRDDNRIMNYTHLELPKPVEWFGVQNLKGAAMLVLTGNCPDGKCDKFTVRKIEADNQVSKTKDFEGIDIECEKPSDLTMDAMYDVVKNENCFNFVCSKKNSFGRTILQYRKQCIKTHVFE